MTRFVLICLCVVLVTIHSKAELSCGPNEMVDSCPNDCSETCPTKEHQQRRCPPPAVCGPPRCRCRFNTKRALNGTCIDTKECPPFECNRPNEEYVACPPYCPTDDCKQATPDGRCPTFGHILVVLECSPACRCIKGHWRNNGTCVPYYECPQHSTALPIFNWK